MSGAAATGRTLRPFLGWGLGFVVLALAGRATTVVADQTLSLVWPAAGAAVAWCLVARDRVGRLAALGLVGVLTLLVVLLTGASWGVAGSSALGGVAQTAVAVWLLRRWCPSLLAGGSTAAHLRELGLGLLALVLGTLAGALVGSDLLRLSGSTLEGGGLLEWWGRHLAGGIVVVTLALLVREALRGERLPRPIAGRAECAALLVAGPVGYVLVFAFSPVPVAFLLMTLAVWAGMRLATWAAAAYSAACGTLAVVLTIVGLGPFADLGDPQLSALVTQAFVLTTLLSTIAVAVGRDARQELIERLAEAQRETEARAELIDAVTETMSDGIVVVDTEDRMVRSNAAARAMLAMTETGFREDVAAYRVLGPDGTEMSLADMPAQRARVEGRPVESDLVLRDADGRRRTLAVRAVPLRQGAQDGRTAASAVVYRDVTEERRSRDRLSDFAEVVAHDLRNPLTATRGWIEQASDLADRLPADPARDDVRVALERARHSAERMNDLVRQVLASARTAALRPVPVELGGADGLLGRIARELGAEGAVVVGEVPGVVMDADLCHQVFTNLVTNAVKYVAEGVPARVEVAGERVGSRVVVRVADNGIGIPEDQRERIFDRLHRVPGSAEDYAGTGLGLAICRDIVERHGGSIRAEPGAGGGTVFVVELPAA